MALCLLSAPALAAGPEKGSSVEGLFVDLDPIVLPIVDGGRVTQSVTFAITLEFAGPADADRARLLKPRLADGFVTALYGMLNDANAPKRGLVDAAEAKKRLLRKAQEILGEARVKAVLLQAVQQRGI
ncbi:MAG: hypothetical protein JKP92_07375 [Alphaproteobacteria bacterium]|nr:hypothetical protein [Alphaproteobacteria bacterium]